MRGRGLRLCAVLLAGCAVLPVGCAGETVAPLPVAANAAPAEASPLTLVVSNQSFDDEVVRIRIAVDGDVIVDADFEVLNQHQWYWFPVDVAVGKHRLQTDAEGVTDVSVVEVGDDPMWVLIDHWGTGATRSLTVERYDQAPAFG